MSDNKNTGVGSVAVLAVCFTILSVHAWSYLPFISDDALISLRYAERLIDGLGPTWTDGERVEGYSNLLWLLLTAALGRIGIDLIVGARLLGFAGSIAAVCAVARFHGRASSSGRLPLLAAGLALALAGPFAIWTVGGLEQPLLAALLAWALVGCCRLLDTGTPHAATRLPRHPTTREWIAPSIALGLICWTRPDGPLFTVTAVIGLFVASGAGSGVRRVAWKLALLPALAVLAQLAFRLTYYGDWWPNPAYAKLGLSVARLTGGLRYLGEGFLWLAPMALPALGVALLAYRRDPAGASSRRARLLAVPLVVWSLYVVSIGGDLFPGRRHLVPIIVILAFLLADGLATLMRREAVSAPVATAAVVAVAIVFGGVQQIDPHNRRARAERWEWDGRTIGFLLNAAFAERDPLLAVDPAGTLPYFSRLRSLDMLGLNDRHLARHRPPDFGSGALGHELGDGAYVLDREPDLVLFCGPAGGARPCFRSGKEMVRDPRFARRYRLVTFESDAPVFRSQIWVRADGGVLGVRREDSRVEVPAYLATTNPETVVTLAADGRPRVALVPGAPAILSGLPLEAGEWSLALDHDGATPRSEVRLAGSAVPVGRGGPRMQFVLQQPVAVDLWVGAGTVEESSLYSITFERAGF